MAFNRANKLQRILQVQEIWVTKRKTGLSTEFIYRNHIQAVYFISRTTFYNYLATNAKKELKEVNEKLNTTKHTEPHVIKSIPENRRATANYCSA